MPPGNPLSQPLGAFHGRSDKFSGSLFVAQPVMLEVAANRTASRIQRGLMERRKLTSGDYLIAFHHVAEFPVGKHVGDGAI